MNNPRISRTTLAVLAVIVFVSTLFTSASYPTDLSAQTSLPNIGGIWKGYNANDKEISRSASIDQSGPSLSFDNGLGSKSKGRFEGHELVAAEDWNVRGTIRAGGNRIDWSNNTYWIKIAPFDLSGSWRAYKRSGEYFARGYIKQDGRTLTFIDIGNGSVESPRSKSIGMFEGNVRVAATDWRVTGAIYDKGSRIEWSNGTHWKR